MLEIILYSVCYYLSVANYQLLTSLQIFEYNPFGYHLIRRESSTDYETSER